MRSTLLVLAACASLVPGCRQAPAARTTTHLVRLFADDAGIGEERASWTDRDQQTTLETRTRLEGPVDASLDGRLVIVRGRASSLRVSGTAPPALPALVDVDVTPDRTDVFPLRGPLPVHVLAALVRQSIVTARRRFQTLPEGSVAIEACAFSEALFPDAICHRITGLPEGPALVWLDERQRLAAAVMRVPGRVLVAVEPEREDARTMLLKRFDVYSAP